MKIKLTFITLLISNLVFSTPYNEKTMEGLTIIQDLSKRESEISDKYIRPKAKNKKKISTIELESRKVQVSDILKSGIFTGTIAKGTELIKIDDESYHYTTREILAKAYRLKDFEGNLYLINSNASSTYKVHFTKISKVDDIINMEKSPLFYRAKKQNDNNNFNDQDFLFESNVNFELAYGSSSFKSDLFNEDNFTDTSFRFEIDSYIKWNFPIDIGLISGIENSNSRLDRGANIAEQNIYLGPSIKFSSLGNFEYTIDIKKVLFSTLKEKTSTETNSFNTTKSSIGVGLLKKSSYTYGHYQWGFNLQQSWMVANAQEMELSVKNKSITDYSISFFLGLGRDWKW